MNSSVDAEERGPNSSSFVREWEGELGERALNYECVVEPWGTERVERELNNGSSVVERGDAVVAQRALNSAKALLQWLGVELEEGGLNYESSLEES